MRMAPITTTPYIRFTFPCTVGRSRGSAARMQNSSAAPAAAITPRVKIKTSAECATSQGSSSSGVCR